MNRSEINFWSFLCKKKEGKMKILIISLIGIVLFLLILFMYCTCVISSRCSREEEKRDEYIRNVQKTIKRR